MQLKLLLVASILLPMLISALQEGDAVDSSAEIDQQWKNFNMKFGKSYATAAEETFRKKVFVETLKEIKAHNALYSEGLTSYTTGINQFSDMEDWEFTKMASCLKEAPRVDESKIAKFQTTSEVLPDVWDWRDTNKVTAVQNQSTCGACWAFAATGALEALMAPTTGDTVPLSEQDLVDCSTSHNNSGCEGGHPDYAFLYVIDEGIASDKTYPYKNKSSESCQRVSDDKKGTCDDYKVVENEDDIQYVVARIGPIAVDMYFPPSLKSYNGEIYDENDCDGTVNHAALIVGYATNSSTNTDYWIIKQSWGDTWGIDGYMHIVRNKKMCKIGSRASYPVNDATSDTTSCYESAWVMYILLLRLFIHLLITK